MSKILELLQSRKFWTALATIIGLVGSGFTGMQPWTHVIAEVVAVVFAWITGQARVDAAKASG